MNATEIRRLQNDDACRVETKTYKTNWCRHL